jgi:hypothetical protein
MEEPVWNSTWVLSNLFMLSVFIARRMLFQENLNNYEKIEGSKCFIKIKEISVPFS